MSKVISETGVLHKVGEMQTGTSKAGKPWAKLEFVISVEDNFQSFRKVAITLWGDDVNALDGYREGDKITVDYYVSAREWNGRWVNDVNFMGVHKPDAEEPKEEFNSRTMEPREGDLPF